MFSAYGSHWFALGRNGDDLLGIVMITTVVTLESALVLAFATACSDLAEARLQRCRKDTPGNRAAVAEAWARVDTVLDMYLEAGGSRR